MPVSSDPSPIIRKLQSHVQLSAAERDAILQLPIRVEQIGRGQDLVRERERPTRSFAILKGFACASKVTARGERQIVTLRVPGDFPDLQSLHLATMDITISTLTACEVGFVSHDALRELCSRHERIANALWRDTLIDAAILREWIVNLGHRDGLTRVAHLLCEFVTRMEAVGLSRDGQCEWPLTQPDVGGVAGMSAVHANRVIQELRKLGLIRLERGSLHVLDWAGLQEIGEFDPAYLHLSSPGPRFP